MRPFALFTSIIALSGFYLEGLYVRLRGLGHTRMHLVSRRWGRRILRWPGVIVSVEGAHHIPSQTACLFVANHVSYSDTPILMGYLPADFRFLAKASLFKVPIIGTHLKHGGHVGVVRDDPRAAVESLAHASRILKEQRTSVVIFAEGTRSHGEGMREFRSGAAHLAIQARVPVVPLAIIGSAEALPKDYLSLQRARVRVVIGEPIPTKGLTRRDRDAFTERLQAAVAALLGPTNGASPR
jgi:1-acyl-sn-glycerol-3-phosphate acyltransferase